MTLSLDRGVLAAILIGVLLHGLFFYMVRPAPVPLSLTRLTPPSTYFSVSSQADGTAVASEVRTIWSPVVFSLPSGMGFSRELHQQDVRTRLSFTQEVETEQFLQVEPAGYRGDGLMIPRDLMVTSGAHVPGLPEIAPADPARKPTAPRVYVAPELKSRLEGGIVLPPVLNQDFSAPWEVRASVSVSEQGLVRHVFLEKPLDEPTLNQQVLQLLYGLRFKSGESIEGSIELYSPRSTAGGPAE